MCSYLDCITLLLGEKTSANNHGSLNAGGNQGIGFETAKNLLSSSAAYHVILGSRKLGNGEEAVKKLQAGPGVKGTVSTIALDVTDDKSVDAAAEKIAAQYGRLDILVNNAGIVSLANPPSREKYRDVLNTKDRKSVV